MQDLKWKTVFPWGIWLLYAILVFAGIDRHEIWMDEAHHWLLARDSPSFPAMLRNLRYEGHPLLWNSCLYIVQLFTSSPSGMQLLHAAIAVGSVALFIGYSPFPWWMKAIFPFGYFPFFEYALISRNYVLAWLTAFIFAAHHGFCQPE